MNRFFTTSITGETITITGDDARHISNVLRLIPGDSVSLCDGNGMECIAVIISVNKGSVCLKPGIVFASESEPVHSVTIFQCLPKTGKMEAVIQKGTELGMYALCPVLSSRCVALPGKDFEKKIERYRKVAAEAAMQSKRGRIPLILPLAKIDALDFSCYDTILLAFEDEKTTTLKHAIKNAGRSIAVVIGPEGGFSLEETQILIKKGATSISLGKRILRTETAGPVSVAEILFELEG